MRAADLFRESAASARSQPIASLATMIMVAGMCAAVLLTSGRTVGAETKVLSTIDSVGTRSIVVRADPESGLDTSVLGRLDNIEGIDWVGAFGPATDVSNSVIPGGTPVPIRSAFSNSLASFNLPTVMSDETTAYASQRALEELGIAGGAGGVIGVEDGVDFNVVGPISVPESLSFLEPFVMNVGALDQPSQPVFALIVVASGPELVAPLTETLEQLLGVEDPSKVQIQTSQNLAELRATVEGQLGSFGRGLVIVILVLTGSLVSTILFALVMIRRRDFGRRRALGATKPMIVGLIVTQTGFLSLLGAVGGSAGAIAIMLIGTDPLPPATYFAAVIVLAAITGVISAVIPAIAASQRDPLRELRVP